MDGDGHEKGSPRIREILIGTGRGNREFGLLSQLHSSNSLVHEMVGTLSRMPSAVL
jgi:hypothetical protein